MISFLARAMARVKNLPHGDFRAVLIFILGGSKMNQTNAKKTKILAEGAIMVALATVLSFLQIVKFPWGGSITVLSMLPIVLFSLRYGVRYGFAISFVFSLVQFGQGIMDGVFGWGLTAWALVGCIFLDYIGAYTVIGIAGVFGNKGIGNIVGGVALALGLRFVFHYVSGVIIFNSFGELWQGFYTDNTWLYSLLYNGAYMLPEIIFTSCGAIALFKAPQTKRILLGNDNDKK